MRPMIGLSTAYLQKLYGDRRALELAKKAGADCVDIDLTHESVDDKTSVYACGIDRAREYYADLYRYARGIGLIVNQTHGRIRGWTNDEAHNDSEMRAAAIDCAVTKELGAKYCVMHTVTTISMGPDAPAPLMRGINDRMFRSILPLARENGITVCTETFGNAEKYGCIDFFGNMDEFVWAYDRVRDEGFSDCFGVCMDTGHTNKSLPYPGQPTPAEAIRRLGDRIKVLHLHDNDTLTDQHKIPGTGTIDWKSVIAALRDIRYDGVYNLEIGLSREHFGSGFACEEAEFAVRVMRQLLR